MCLFIGACVYALWLSVARTRYTPTRRNLYLCKSYKRVLSLRGVPSRVKVVLHWYAPEEEISFFTVFSLSRLSLVHALSLGAFNKNNKLDKTKKMCYNYFAWTGKDILLGGSVLRGAKRAERMPLVEKMTVF